jgi:hypothetical protein
MGACTQTLGHTFTTARTVVAGERGWHGDDSFASVVSLGVADTPHIDAAGGASWLG